MKLYPALFAALLVAASASAQSADPAFTPSYFSDDASYAVANRAVLERNYLECLKSQNDGVVESGLAHLIRMKLAFPAEQFPRIEAELSRLTVQGASAPIRYKAYLACVVFNDINLLEVAECRSCTSPETLFSAVAARIHETALSLR